MKNITLKGARVHNLKNIDLELPREKLSVITGVSGSGKSSLAFDTIYAEGQRRYVESLSAYARQFLEQMDKPDLESIEGLSPAIAIEQKTTSKNPRSTVGTVTEIYDYLRLLFTRIGTPHCTECKALITNQTISQMVERVLTTPAGSKILILSPIVRARKGEYRKELATLLKTGYTRVKIDGELMSLEEPISLDKRRKHTIEVVIDRIILRQSVRARLAESLEISTSLSGGFVRVEDPNGKELFFFNESLSCIKCGLSFPELTQSIFSFNSQQGSCTKCNGMGESFHFDPDLIIPDPTLSIDKNAILPWAKKGGKGMLTRYTQAIDALAAHYAFDTSLPYKELPPRVREIIMHGSGAEVIHFEYKKGRKHYSFHQPFEGIVADLETRHAELEQYAGPISKGASRDELKRFMNSQLCTLCHGSRLKKTALATRIGNKSIWDIVQMQVLDSALFFKELELTPREQEIARRIIKEITERLSFLIQVGLDYITLDRGAATLSGGEGQRIRLATQIGSGLVGVLYVLDEPSIGLHQRDNMRLIASLMRLRNMGNTVLVVEHDETTIRNADFVVDMGPGAGELGGEIVAKGTPAEIIANPASITGRYLSGSLSIPVPKERKKPDDKFITMTGLQENNLKDLTVKIPLGITTCVTGVSGSGKSTLIIDTLYRQAARRLYGSTIKAGKVTSITGLEDIDKVIDVDQSPIGRTPRSNPATYSGLFTPIRELFSQLPEARMRGYGPGRFSFNVRGGRCEACMGDGLIKVEMHFLPDVYVHCDVCETERYNSETLEVRYKGQNITECLEMTVDHALNFFKNIPQIKSKLQVLSDVGLGYIRLGQSATTLSGGEAQRIKLARELSKRATGKTLYILDEPTTGLHFADTKKLINVLASLRDAGNTIVIIEHNMDIIKTSDYVIDLGPEGGKNGGLIIAEGTPEEVSRAKNSHTGRFLQEVLADCQQISASN